MNYRRNFSKSYVRAFSLDIATNVLKKPVFPNSYPEPEYFGSDVERVEKKNPRKQVQVLLGKDVSGFRGARGQIIYDDGSSVYCITPMPELLPELKRTKGD